MMRYSFIVRSAVAVAALVCALGFIAVYAQTPTSRPTATPVPTSLITIRFVSNGEAATVILNAPLRSLTADGAGCLIPIPQIVGPASGYSIRWPLLPGADMAKECTHGPPTTLRFEFQSGPIILATEFVWTGGDMTVDLEVPSALVLTPTPSATPPVVATALPATGLGDRATPAGGLGILLPAALAGIAALATFAAGLALKRG